MRINILFLCFLMISCSSSKNDPLKNTKKLIKEGHTSLYQNGAFQIPSSRIKLVTPGPEPFELAKELSGTRAKASFLRYVDEMKDTSVVIWDGSKKSYHFSQQIDKELDKELTKIAPALRQSSQLIITKSFATSKNIIGGSWKTSGSVYSDVAQAGREINKDFSQAGDRFIKNFVIIPKKTVASEEGVSLDDFVQNFKKSNEFRKRQSSSMTYLINDTVSNYFKNIQHSFNKSDQEMNEFDPTYGYTLATLKAMVWVLKGVVVDGMIVPFGKMSAGALGYSLVNGVAYPVLLVSKNGVTSTQYAVEIIGHASSKTYEVLAPNLQIGLGAVLNAGMKSTGFIVGNSIEYVAAPVAATSTLLGGSATGVAVGVGGSVLAGASLTGSGVMALSSKMISKSVSTATLLGGVTAYTIKGSAEFAYEVSKATVVPPGMVLGGGLTLTYGSLVHLGAHSVLAVSDAAYLVLSMEGPKWVIYAVKGKLGGGDYAKGTVLDLDKMKKEGEEFYKVPVEEENIKKILDELSAS